ncbi:hypothetical protein J4711_14870 [Staphylococcus epidermidis]|nr:hypothetical protein [Staphylococcus epidermidis]
MADEQLQAQVSHLDLLAEELRLAQVSLNSLANSARTTCWRDLLQLLHRQVSATHFLAGIKKRHLSGGVFVL